MVANFNEQFDRVLDGFTGYRMKSVTLSKWGVRQVELFRASALLFMYVRALTGYDPSSETNFLTDDQVVFIFKQTTKLIGKLNGPVFP